MFPLKDDQPRYSTPYRDLVPDRDQHSDLSVRSVAEPRRACCSYSISLDGSSTTGGFSVGRTAIALQAVVPFSRRCFCMAEWMHVLGNMWFLYIFGDNVEDYLGHFPYLIFYLLSGLCAGAVQSLVNPHSHVATVGASGAIAGVLGAYFLLYPRSRVLTWFFVFVMYLPAWVVLGEWIVLQFLQGGQMLTMAAKRDVGGVAFWAHVGGFLAGLIMIKLFPERKQRYPYATRRIEY